MAAPSKSFTFIPDGDIDPDSPITTGLMTELRDNDQHLESWLGESFVAAVDHNHDGVNSKLAGIGFIERHEATADETSFDFSATLDGDTEAVYLLTGRWKDDVAGSQGLFLRANTVDTTVPVAGVAAQAGANFAYFMGLIFAKRTVQTVSMNPGYVGISVDNITPTFSGRGNSFTLAANITSLGLIVTTASNIRKGSSFNLYRLAQS